MGELLAGGSIIAAFVGTDVDGADDHRRRRVAEDVERVLTQVARRRGEDDHLEGRGRAGHHAASTTSRPRSMPIWHVNS